MATALSQKLPCLTYGVQSSAPKLRVRILCTVHRSFAASGSDRLRRQDKSGDVRPVDLGNPLCRLALNCADDRSENSASNTAARQLADDRANIGGRGRIGEHRNDHPENLPADTTTNGARDGVSNRAEIDVRGCLPGDVSANGAADNLHNEIDEQSGHGVVSP